MKSDCFYCYLPYIYPFYLPIGLLNGERAKRRFVAAVLNGSEHIPQHNSRVGFIDIINTLAFNHIAFSEHHLAPVATDCKPCGVGGSRCYVCRIVLPLYVAIKTKIPCRIYRVK